jgi:hypothetical protein
MASQVTVNIGTPSSAYYSQAPPLTGTDDPETNEIARYVLSLCPVLPSPSLPLSLSLCSVSFFLLFERVDGSRLREQKEAQQRILAQIADKVLAFPLFSR